MGARDFLKPTLLYYGVDTETYNNPTNGLKSIQVYGESIHYFTTDDWDLDDETIRYDISKQFIDWLNDSVSNVILGFFNLDFDFSQFAYYLICQSGYEYIEHDGAIKKNQLRILESERKLYKVEFINPLGKRVLMIDIANFLTATNLNKACQDWIGKSKIDLPSKDFPKCQASEIEKEYAIMDAKLTYELLLKLIDSNVIENKTVTIAGRTIRHFEQYLKEKWGISFNKFAYGTDDKDLVADYIAKNE